MRYVNLVLQGGGVKGIAYAGALQHVPDDVHFHTIAGTSAGSVVAALLATGVPPARVIQVMRGMRFSEFLSPDDSARNLRLRSFATSMRNALEANSWLARLWQFRRVPLSLVGKNSIANDMRKLVNEKGLFSTSRLADWLHRQFGDKKFKDIVCPELLIVAADIGSGQYKVFSKLTDPEVRIADAVLASSSIPGFFQPFRNGTGAYVDGGLLSNFPSWLLDRRSYASIGLKLAAFEQNPPIHTLNGYTQSLLSTALQAHDRVRQRNPYLQTFEIPVAGISATDFDLSDQSIDQLVAAGSAVGQVIDWQKAARTNPITLYADLRSDELLEHTLDGIEKLTESYTSSQERPLYLNEEMEIGYRIRGDWSVHLALKSKYEITGPRPMKCRRITLTNMENNPSFMDRMPKITAISSNSKHRVIMIPWRNLQNDKGFSLFFDPPIREGDTGRGMEWSIEFPDDHRKLRETGNDTFPFTVRQLSESHVMNARIAFYVATSLGDVGVGCDDSQCQEQDASDEVFEGQAYRKFAFLIEGWRISNRVQMRFVFQRR